MVDVTALRRGERDLAFGDVTGSCLVDASLSLGIGPLIAPTMVTAALAVPERISLKPDDLQKREASMTLKMGERSARVLAASSLDKQAEGSK